MVTQIKVTGMVLGTMPVGEYDKRIVLLTKERGKITAFAKGARKQNSALLACTQPFAFGEFMIYEGRSSYSIMSANISNYFIELREEIDAIGYGLYFLELAEYLTTENTEEGETLKLLYQTLRAMIKKTISYELIRYIYELRILTIHGEAPQVFQCVKCDVTEKLKVFHPQTGGLLCVNCCKGKKTYISVCSSTIYTMQYIITSTLEKLYTFIVSKEVLEELHQCMNQYYKVRIGREFKSLEMLRW